MENGDPSWGKGYGTNTNAVSGELGGRACVSSLVGLVVARLGFARFSTRPLVDPAALAGAVVLTIGCEVTGGRGGRTTERPTHRRWETERSQQPRQSRVGGGGG